MTTKNDPLTLGELGDLRRTVAGNRGRDQREKLWGNGVVDRLLEAIDARDAEIAERDRLIDEVWAATGAERGRSSLPSVIAQFIAAQRGNKS